MTHFLFLLLLTINMIKVWQDDRLPTNDVAILFEIVQNQEIYDQSVFGEPPQLGIWLENEATGEVRTVFVTEKLGKGSFYGKAGVPVALPAWVSAFRSETGRSDFPTLRNPVVDGTTGPTEQNPLIKKSVIVGRGSDWKYYIEVNVAGDYNQAFPSFRDDGSPDPDENGQPSLIYVGKIAAHPGEYSEPVLIGRTEQLFFSSVINTDLTGIDSAAKLLSLIKVSCMVHRP